VRRLSLLVTCEHGGNDVPPECAALFAGHDDVLASHRGWDPGALPVARLLARRLDAPLHFSTTTRLVVDLNRSINNAGVFSSLVLGQGDAFLVRLLRDHYVPYRAAVASTIDAMLASGETVLHFSVHTFTPELDGTRRTADAAILYDPGLPTEAGVAQRLAAALERHLHKPVRHNYPYLGTQDGFTTRLKALHPVERYLGIELELNHGPWLTAGGDWQGADEAVVAAMQETLATGLA
jgi:predicted N-formylglutamate amidohydrolase